MSFLDTQPAPLDACDIGGPWESFRVRDPLKLLGILREISRADRPVTMGAPGGPAITLSLWSVDDMQHRLHFQVAPHMPQAQQVAQHADLWAAAYLDDAKLQWPVLNALLSVDANGQVLIASIPDKLYRLPRRASVRVRRDAKEAPTVRFRHPQSPSTEMALKVLDLSASGCALAVPPGALRLCGGMHLAQVEVELDSDNIVFADLAVRHVTAPGKDGRARAGCEWQGMPMVAKERLQQWIQRGQRRRELISLSFD